MQVDLSVIISSYEGRDRIMNENLIVEVGEDYKTPQEIYNLMMRKTPKKVEETK